MHEIESKYPLTTKEDIDNHAKWAKALMQKGAADFKKRLEERER